MCHSVGKPAPSFRLHVSPGIYSDEAWWQAPLHIRRSCQPLPHLTLHKASLHRGPQTRSPWVCKISCTPITQISKAFSEDKRCHFLLLGFVPLLKSHPWFFLREREAGSLLPPAIRHLQSSGSQGQSHSLGLFTLVIIKGMLTEPRLSLRVKKSWRSQVVPGFCSPMPAHSVGELGPSDTY